MRVVVVLLALLGTAVATALRPVTSNQRIAGGEPTTVQQYPFMARMDYNTYGNSFYQSCGGSIISRTAVVSAAHCFYGDPSIAWRVVVGTSYRSTGGTTHFVARIINHEFYDRPSTLNNDVAVVILRTPVAYSSSVAPIKLAAAHYNLPDGAVVTTIGWGALVAGFRPPEQLQHVDINVISQKLCEERYHVLKEDPRYEAWPNITETMICAGVLDVGGKNACEGDSGGPLFHGDVLVGLVSFSRGCGDPYYPGVSTRVSALADWIVRHGAE